MEAGLRPNSAGIPYTLLLRIEAIGFPTFGLLLYVYIYMYRVESLEMGFRVPSRDLLSGSSRGSGNPRTLEDRVRAVVTDTRFC